MQRNIRTQIIKIHTFGNFQIVIQINTLTISINSLCNSYHEKPRYKANMDWLKRKATLMLCRQTCDKETEIGHCGRPHQPGDWP